MSQTPATGPAVDDIELPTYDRLSDDRRTPPRRSIFSRQLQLPNWQTRLMILGALASASLWLFRQADQRYVHVDSFALSRDSIVLQHRTDSLLWEQFATEQREHDARVDTSLAGISQCVRHPGECR